MRVIDFGHDYWLTSFDGGDPIRLPFVKRNDPPEKYPGNEDAHPGTQIQEVLRALIERGDYVNGQFSCPQTTLCLELWKESLWLLEQRHCERHGDPGGMNSYNHAGIAKVEFCRTCGHIVCYCEKK